MASPGPSGCTSNAPRAGLYRIRCPSTPWNAKMMSRTSSSSGGNRPGRPSAGPNSASSIPRYSSCAPPGPRAGPSVPPPPDCPGAGPRKTPSLSVRDVLAQEPHLVGQIGDQLGGGFGSGAHAVPAFASNSASSPAISF